MQVSTILAWNYARYTQTFVQPRSIKDTIDEMTYAVYLHQTYRRKYTLYRCFITFLSMS